jgi:hypothetical protein
MCRRRFDERLDTRLYTAMDERVGGSLLGSFDLRLDDDFKRIDKVINGDGQVLTNWKPLRTNSNYGVIAYTEVHLNIYGGVVWRSGGIDPYESISISGLVGFGGQWVDTGLTLAANLTSSATSLIASDGTQLEPGMVLRLVATNTPPAPPTTEYLFVDAVPTTTGGNVTVGRGYNGSAAVAWTSPIELYYWQAMDSVRDIVRRLVQWKAEQVLSPVASTVTVGDFSFPVNLSGLPTDLYLTIRDGGLIRVNGAIGV